VKDLQGNNKILDKERDFYFSKLRLIEEVLQKSAYETHPMGEAVLKVLYAGEEEQIEVNGDGHLEIMQDGKKVIHEIKKNEQIEPKADGNDEQMAD